MFLDRGDPADPLVVSECLVIGGEQTGYFSDAVARRMSSLR